MPPANYVHPEFGYLCPTSRLRRDFRVAVVSIALGGIIGAAVVTLRAGHDRDADSALMVAHVAHPAESVAADAAPGATDTGIAKPDAVKLEAIKTDRIKIDAVKADAAEPVTDGAKTGGAKTDSTKTDGAKTDSVKADGTKADAAKPTCQDNTWAYLDGTCVASKPRRVKVRAATDSPAIGAAPLGRTVSTSVAAPAPAAANAPQISPSSAAPSNVTPSNATPSAETSPPAAAATKKPQKVVRSQSRASDRSVRDERANYSNARGYAGYANAPGAYRQGPPNQGLYGWFW